MKLVTLAAALLLVSSTPEAWSQQSAPAGPGVRANTHEGFWISIGLGAGSAGADCSICTNERETGLSGYFRLGAAVTPQVLIGVETNGWTKSEGGLDQTISALSAVAYWYPVRNGPVFLRGGLGLMTFTADDGFDELTATGLALSVGAGYNFRTGRNFSLTPFINILVNGGADAKINGSSVGEDFNTNVVQFGLGVMWH